MPIDCIRLHDDSAGTEARVLAGFGFNCFSFTVPYSDRVLDVLWAHDQFQAGTERPSGSGIPLLFPFPGRLAGTAFHWNGEVYELAPGDARGNAIHGLVLDRPWRVVEQTAQRVTGEFQASRDGPDRLARWPADFLVRVTYSLHRSTLRATLSVSNPDDRPLPCGLGMHPYFRLPLGGRRPDECLVQLPVAEYWELSDMLPTGRRLPVLDADRYQRGLPFGALELDHVFTGLQFAGRTCTSSITDPDSQVRVALSFDRSFRECVVYTPPHRQAICVEPYTCVPGGQQLEATGIETGWRVLEPGGVITSEIEIRAILPERPGAP